MKNLGDHCRNLLCILQACKKGLKLELYYIFDQKFNLYRDISDINRLFSMAVSFFVLRKMSKISRKKKKSYYYSTQICQTILNVRNIKYHLINEKKKKKKKK